MKIGIISSQFCGVDLVSPQAYEIESLRRSFASRGVSIFLIDPEKTFYGIKDNSAYCYFFNSDGMQLSAADLDVLLIKRTRGAIEQVVDFAGFAKRTNSKLLVSDPLSCFTRPTNKMDSIMLRSGVFNQPDSSVMNRDFSGDFLKFPLIVKPYFGAAGKSIGLAKGIENLKEKVSQATGNDVYRGKVAILQSQLSIEREYRVMVIGGRSAGLAIKDIPADGIVGNASQGVKFKSANAGGLTHTKQREIEAFAERIAVFHGYDVAGVDLIEAHGELYVIECNRNPQFSEFDSATGMRCSDLIADMIVEKRNESQVVFQENKEIDKVKITGKPRIFVGSSSEGKEVARALQYGLDDVAEVVIWDQGIFSPSKFALQSLIEEMRSFDYALFAFTQDDYVISRNKSIFAPRDNVIFEAGLFMGAIGSERVFMVAEKLDDPTKIPSDLHGLNIIRWGRHSSGDLRSSLGRAVSEIIYAISGR